MSFANNTSHMLFILIPIAWLTVVVLFAAICRSAARGDGDASRAQLERKTRTLDTSIAGLVLWEDQLDVSLQDKRTHKARRRTLAGHGLPRHGVR
jgi:high-affinity K+ transport system ATPase subunit B